MAVISIGPRISVVGLCIWHLACGCLEHCKCGLLECVQFLNNPQNDPHDWMVDDSASASNGEVTVQCNTACDTILGLTVLEFCQLASDGISACIRKCIYPFFAVKYSVHNTLQQR